MDNIPICPLCGTKSTWVLYENMRPELHNRIPDECKFCKQEDFVHWRDWEQGIDVTEFGGTPHNANVEAGMRATRKPNMKGERIA